MQSIHAIFENGVFRPVVPVELPERTEFVFEPRPVSAPLGTEDNPLDSTPENGEELRKVYAILSERYASGHTDTAARHNEHQP